MIELLVTLLIVSALGVVWVSVQSEREHREQEEVKASVIDPKYRGQRPMPTVPELERQVYGGYAPPLTFNTLLSEEEREWWLRGGAPIDGVDPFPEREEQYRAAGLEPPVSSSAWLRSLREGAS